MIDRQKTQRATGFLTGAPAAQMPAKSLKSFVPLAKSSGALSASIKHKKTPEPVWFEGSAPLDLLNFLRKLLHSAQLVNPIVTGTSK
jgi:hypothetical protein